MCILKYIQTNKKFLETRLTLKFRGRFIVLSTFLSFINNTTVPKEN